MPFSRAVAKERQRSGKGAERANKMSSKRWSERRSERRSERGGDGLFPNLYGN
jgi:hypothetical protein